MEGTTNVWIWMLFKYRRNPMVPTIYYLFLSSRKCKRRLGPNDISESTVRFVSLYDKAPI